MKYPLYVTDFSKPIHTNGVKQGYGTKLFWFEHFEAYWHYKYLQAKELDTNGFIRKRPDGSEEHIFTNYAEKYYIKNYKTMEESIKSTTNCPTCGSEVRVEAEGEIHFYVPKHTYSEDEVEELLYELNDQINITSGGLSLSVASLSVWINKHLKK